MVIIMKIITHRAVVFLFGLIFPVFLLVSSYTSLKAIDDKLHQIDTTEELKSSYASLRGNLVSANDYILYSLMFVEQSNQRTMLNKQTLKVAIIHIGLAVMSVGMMFIILGISDGGGESVGETSGIKLSFKTTSSGIAVFVAGALMAAGGALINNLYVTASIPGFVQILNSGQSQEGDKDNELVALYKSCQKYDEEKFRLCLVSMVQQLYAEELK